MIATLETVLNVTVSAIAKANAHSMRFWPKVGVS